MSTKRDGNQNIDVLDAIFSTNSKSRYPDDSFSSRKRNAVGFGVSKRVEGEPAYSSVENTFDSERSARLGDTIRDPGCGPTLQTQLCNHTLDNSQNEQVGSMIIPEEVTQVAV